MDTHTDDFIEQRPGFVQPIIRSAVSRREGPTAFFATVAPPSTLRGGVKGVSNDVAFAGLASQGAIGVWTAARSSSAPLHTCLIVEKPEKIQLAQGVAGLPDTVSNTSLKKHLFKTRPIAFRLCYRPRYQPKIGDQRSLDHFIEQRPGFMQPIIRSAVGGREGSTAFFATVSPPSTLRGDVKGVPNDVAFS